MLFSFTSETITQCGAIEIKIVKQSSTEEDFPFFCSVELSVVFFHVGTPVHLQYLSIVFRTLRQTFIDAHPKTRKTMSCIRSAFYCSYGTYWQLMVQH